MAKKYRVNVCLRKFDDESCPVFNHFYYECDNVRQLNDWIFHHICNSSECSEIIGFYFENF